MSGQRFWGLRLQPGVSRRSMGAYYAACLVGLSAFVFIAGAQSLLLDLIGVEENKGRISGRLGVAGEIVLLLAVGVAGSLSDRIGRRVVFSFGFLFVAAGLVLSPFANSVLGLGVGRVVFAVGAAAVTAMISTVVADYVLDGDRGKAAGLLGVMNGVGAVLAVFVLVRLPDLFSGGALDERQAAQGAYGVVALLCVGMSVWLFFGLVRGRHSKEESPPLGRLLREGATAAREPGIALAYAAAFVSRGNLAVVGTFFALWLQDYGSNERGMSSTEALARAGIVIGVAQTFALVAAPFFGRMADRMHRVDALVVACAIAAVGYTSTLLVDDPLGAGMYACAALIGIGEVGGVIASLVLIGQLAPPRLRGSVIGAFSACGAIGILTALELGGFLFDAWRPAAPFAFFGLVSGLVAVLGLLLRSRVPRHERDVPGEDAVETVARPDEAQIPPQAPPAPVG